MTGFARVEGEADGISWVWELKSVNSRSLDLRLRLPPGFDALEAQLRASLARHCLRGNRAMLAQIVALLGDLAGEIDAAPPRLDGLIGLRGILETVEDEPERVIEARRQAVLAGWSAALEKLAAARA